MTTPTNPVDATAAHKAEWLISEMNARGVRFWTEEHRAIAWNVVRLYLLKEIPKPTRKEGDEPCPQLTEQDAESVSNGAETEGPSPSASAPRTEEEANELADNGRNTGGKSYYRPILSPTPAPASDAPNEVDAEPKQYNYRSADSSLIYANIDACGGMSRVSETIEYVTAREERDEAISTCLTCLDLQKIGRQQFTRRGEFKCIECGNSYCREHARSHFTAGTRDKLGCQTFEIATEALELAQSQLSLALSAQRKAEEEREKWKRAATALVPGREEFDNETDRRLELSSLLSRAETAESDLTSARAACAQKDESLAEAFNTIPDATGKCGRVRKQITVALLPTCGSSLITELEALKKAINEAAKILFKFYGTGCLSVESRRIRILDECTSETEDFIERHRELFEAVAASHNQSDSQAPSAA